MTSPTEKKTTPQQEDMWALSLRDKLLHVIYGHLDASRQHIAPVALGMVVAKLNRGRPEGIAPMIKHIAKIAEREKGYPL